MTQIEKRDGRMQGSAERLQRALAAGGVGLWEYDPATERIECPAFTCTLLGLSPATQLNRHTALQSLHPDDRPALKAALEAALDPAGSGAMSGEFRVPQPDGQIRWFAYTGQAAFGAEGSRRRAVALTGTVREITGRKQLEEALQERDRRNDEFLGLLAHELRNPLSSLSSGLHIMRQPGASSAMVQAARNMMERQLGQMVRLLDDLLDVSRITRGKLELQLGCIELVAVLRSALEASRPLIEQGRHQLSFDVPAEPIPLRGDAARLAQAFAGLLANSARYTPAGGRIRLTARREESQAIVTVTDSGIGIPPEALSSAFDLYAQVKRGAERAGGLGLGLPLAHGIVALHGGLISARSEEAGHGTSFEVRLPLTTERPAVRAETGDAAAELHSGTRHRILVVDDNRDSAASLAMMLELLGHEVHQAHDGLEALELTESLRPALILMDVGMPQLNGFETTRRIRSSDWGRDVSIIMLTGFGRDEDRARSAEAGADGHLVKPVDLQRLESLLTDLRTRHG